MYSFGAGLRGRTEFSDADPVKPSGRYRTPRAATIPFLVLSWERLPAISPPSRQAIAISERCGGGTAVCGLCAGGDREVPTLSKPLLSPILDNDAITRGLGDAEARILVEWLVELVEQVAEAATSEKAARQKVEKLCRRGRAIGRFVGLWCHAASRGAAGQLAVAERFTWPFPAAGADPCEVMHEILVWETDHPEGS
jgi:hypothetical protein